MQRGERTSISQLATELILKTLLVELASDGTRYAHEERLWRSKDAHQMGLIANEKLKAVSNVLASILPGVCPAQVTAGFEKFMAGGKDPYCGMDESDVMKLLVVIENVWKDDESCAEL